MLAMGAISVSSSQDMSAAHQVVRFGVQRARPMEARLPASSLRPVSGETKVSSLPMTKPFANIPTKVTVSASGGARGERGMGALRQVHTSKEAVDLRVVSPDEQISPGTSVVYTVTE